MNLMNNQKPFFDFNFVNRKRKKNMKEYDVIAIGSGSSTNIIEVLIRTHPDYKIALIDKDDPGGICLTKGCIPSKILIYPAEVLSTIKRANSFGINVDIKKIDFKYIMNRMRSIIHKDIDNIKRGLTSTKELDFYQEIAEFVEPYVLKVGKEKIKGKIILLGLGSKPRIPNIKGLDKVSYHTSDSILNINILPKSICIIGGGYIAAEYGFFFSQMGSQVTILEYLPQILNAEEPEISALAHKELSKELKIITNCKINEVTQISGKKKILATNIKTKENLEIITDEIFIAVGRSSNADILHPEKSGINVDENDWIIVDEYLQTSKPNIWAYGDAKGKYLFKHVANYESQLVYLNAFQKKKIKVDYHAIPHAVFTDPEIASVGLRESEALKIYGENNILIGFQRFEDTAKGVAMNLKDCFVKIIIHSETSEILGAHIIGPFASVLIQEIINLMYTPERSILPLIQGMHIHPALAEVIDRAVGNLMPVKQYHHYLEHLGLSIE